MKLLEFEFNASVRLDQKDLIAQIHDHSKLKLFESSLPLRFAITKSSAESVHCEVGVLQGVDPALPAKNKSIFDFAPRRLENQDRFTAVMLVPTGIGAIVGGHAGDAAPASRLLAACCDTLITHPNVLNGSDINEITENTLYVEGSAITRLMMGTAGLAPRRTNRILTIVEEHTEPIINNNVVNAVNAARGSAGFACERIEILSPPLKMTTSCASSGRATGEVEGLEVLFEIIHRNRDWVDAVALTSVVGLDEEKQEAYFTEWPLQSDNPDVEDPGREMVNLFGGIEALLTHCLLTLFDLPVAHAPMYDSVEIMNSDPGHYEARKAAEAVSVTFLHSVLKGLSRSPGIVTDPTLFSHRGVISNADVSCLVIPDGCIGLPTLAALEQRIPVIAIRGNKNVMCNDLSKLPWDSDQFFLVDNYWEAAGVMSALRAGVPPATVRRPLANAELVQFAKHTAALKKQTAHRPSLGGLDPMASPGMPSERDGCVWSLPDHRKD
jgi:Protein of unknown function (DUF3326)